MVTRMEQLPSEPHIDIATRIVIRGQRVLLDQDLALLYGVTIKRLNQQVRRNLERFPGDFLFQLKPEEANSLRMHFATLKKSRGAHRSPASSWRLHKARRISFPHRAGTS